MQSEARKLKLENLETPPKHQAVMDRLKCFGLKGMIVGVCVFPSGPATLKEHCCRCEAEEQYAEQQVRTSA